MKIRWMYPDAGYGGRFGIWVFSDDRDPYNSYGNGSAMRVSPYAWMMDCGFCARTGMWPPNGRAGARLSAEVTHNHQRYDAIFSAVIISAAIMVIMNSLLMMIRRRIKEQNKAAKVLVYWGFPLYQRQRLHR